MARLIDADALKAKLREGLEHYQYRPDDFAIGKVSGLVDAMEEVDRAPTVDAIPIGWLIEQANDPERAPLYRRYAQMLYEEWQKEQEAR